MGLKNGDKREHKHSCILPCINTCMNIYIHNHMQIYMHTYRKLEKEKLTWANDDSVL